MYKNFRNLFSSITHNDVIEGWRADSWAQIQRECGGKSIADLEEMLNEMFPERNNNETLAGATWFLLDEEQARR